MDPTLLIHPGEILEEEFLKPYGLRASAFAVSIGLPANRVTEIVAGKRSITPDTAVLFGEAFGTTAEFWLNLQARHDLDVARMGVPSDRIEKARALRKTLTAA
jgi:antitoxin HigA-1